MFLNSKDGAAFVSKVNRGSFRHQTREKLISTIVLVRRFLNLANKLCVRNSIWKAFTYFFDKTNFVQESLLKNLIYKWSCGVVVITSALHAEGPQFDPARDHSFYFIILYHHLIQNSIFNLIESESLINL